MALEDDRAGSGIDPAHPQVQGAAPQSLAGGCKVSVRRTGQAVVITLTSSSEYASIELYDSLVQSVERGCLRLELQTARA
jgi:hypothetical protein